MKKLSLIFLSVLLILCTFVGCEEEGPLKPTENFYVNDFADVITDADEKEMLSRAVALNEATTAQVVVLTVESLDGEEPWEYALEIGREWGVGDEEKDNGIVLLFAESDREIYIAVGYGLEGALPDSKTGRIIDNYGLEDLKEDNFSKGIKNIAYALVNEVYLEYGVEPEAGYTPIDQLPENTEEDASLSDIIISWIVLIIIIVAFSYVFRGRGGGMFFIVPTRFGGGGGFSSGGGSFGGFRGGGGSFGGGGAGRGF